jgi:LuxR family maltose regulon positive regulatory protein
MIVADRPASPLKQPEPLLATRFFPPRLPAERILRLRLLARLDEGLTLPFLLISASAGCGKSLLVSEWVHIRPGLRAGWLSLERSENDWPRFFRYLVAAWQRIIPHAGETALAELDSSPSPQAGRLVSYLLNDLQAGQETLEGVHALLVLDDYHCVEASAIHETVAYLVEHLPPSCHIALITRTDPPLPISRWRSRRQMMEIRAGDLRFTPAEASEFLNQAMHLGLEDEQVDILETRTEGWVVGLQLAALALRTHEDTQAFIQAFSGSHRYVLDYLMEEVISQQLPEIQQFLLATAPLERFCAGLVSHTLGSGSPAAVNVPDAQKILERMEKANLFLIPLDDQRRWFRYHHLFADLLRMRLLQEDPGRAISLYARAAEWYAQNRMWREAILCSLQANNYEEGVRLFEQSALADGMDFFLSGTGPLLESFPPGWIARHPVLSLAKAVRMIESSHLEGIDLPLRKSISTLEAAPSFEGQLTLLGIAYVAQGIAASLLGDSPCILESSRRVADLLPGDFKANNLALIQLGNVSLYEGNLHQVDACWQQALELSLANNHPFGIQSNLDNLARLCCYKGELNRAEKLLQRGLRFLQTGGSSSPRWLGATQRDYTDLLRERNRLEEAREMADSSLELCEKWEMISGMGLGYIHRGRVLLAQGDMAGAEEMLQRAGRLCQVHTVYPDLEATVEVFRSRLMLARDDLEPAARVLDICLASACCRHAFHREWVLIAQARVLLRMGLPGDALRLLEGRLEPAWQNGRGTNWLEMCLLSCLAWSALGNRPKALVLLEKGLGYAQAQGFVRLFVDEGEPARALIETYQEQDLQEDLAHRYARDLLAAFPAAERPKGKATSEALIEPLSSREVEILRLVCDGLSNQEIAGRLVLSVGTVKSHIHHIYGKLDVRDRPQAIARAGRLKLV